jgi:hypothetical protein
MEIILNGSLVLSADPRAGTNRYYLATVQTVDQLPSEPGTELVQ